MRARSFAPYIWSQKNEIDFVEFAAHPRSHPATFNSMIRCMYAYRGIVREQRPRG